MLRSWEVTDNGNAVDSVRYHYTIKGVARRMRRVQRAGGVACGELPNGGYLAEVETIPGSWKD